MILHKKEGIPILTLKNAWNLPTCFKYISVSILDGELRNKLARMPEVKLKFFPSNHFLWILSSFSVFEDIWENVRFFKSFWVHFIKWCWIYIGPPTSFSPVTSTNVESSPENFLNFSIKPFPHYYQISRLFLVRVSNYWT